MDTQQPRFDALVDAYYRPLYRYAYWLCHGQSALAEDLVQETFLRAWRGLDSLHEPGAAKAWLTTILRRENARRFQKKQLEITEYDLDQVADPQPSTTQSTDQQMLAQMIARLPEHYREPLALQILFGYTQHEVASILQLPANTVATRLRRARLQLREWISEPQGLKEHL